jgi:hypothetical protein
MSVKNDLTHFPPQYTLDTAILFLVFNRLDTTKQVFEVIQKVKPPRLYVAADGPRPQNMGDLEKVQAVRDYILRNIDWECQVDTLFRDYNLGCKLAVSGAISWFFENEEQGIILEDDCLPSHSFFRYCEELLVRYKNDTSVYLISGDSRGTESFEMSGDYGFCKYPIIWGWASWARVWKNYDPDLSDWPEQRQFLLPSISSYKPTINFWKTTFDKLYMKQIDTWDYQFSYLLLKNRGRCIVPKINLITNIGFGVDATHTHFSESESANRKRNEINFPLNHVINPESEQKINDFYDRNEYSLMPIIFRVFNKFARLKFS